MAYGEHTEDTDESGDGSGRKAELIEAALQFAQRRDVIFGQAFGNPAWEIMLRLYAAASKNEALPLDALIASTLRSKATQRWLDALVQNGLVQLTSPGRTSSARLTMHGKASMDALFASANAETPVS